MKEVADNLQLLLRFLLRATFIPARLTRSQSADAKDATENGHGSIELSHSMPTTETGD